MALAISRTAPFRHLQKQIGSATYRLNTVLVGLEFIADGGDKSARLPVTWTKPANPQEARNAANQAGILACTASFVLASDIFDEFLSGLASEDWLLFSDEAKSIATKAKPRSKTQGGDYSVAERCNALLDDLRIPVSPALGGIELLSKWRNVSVHSGKRKVGLNKELEKLLLESKEHFCTHYSHFDIDLALRNFWERKNPVPKEATSLIAVVQNISRDIDEAAIKRVAGTSDLVIDATNKLLSDYFNADERSISAWTEICEAWQGSLERRTTNFKKILQRVGLTDSKKAVSAPLPQRYVDELVDSTRDDVASRFAVTKPS